MVLGREAADGEGTMMSLIGCACHWSGLSVVDPDRPSLMSRRDLTP